MNEVLISLQAISLTRSNYKCRTEFLSCFSDQFSQDSNREMRMSPKTSIPPEREAQCFSRHPQIQIRATILTYRYYSLIIILDITPSGVLIFTRYTPLDNTVPPASLPSHSIRKRLGASLIVTPGPNLPKTDQSSSTLN